MKSFASCVCIVFALSAVPLAQAQPAPPDNSVAQPPAEATPPSEAAPPAETTLPAPAQPPENKTATPARSKAATKLKSEARKDKKEEHQPADPDTGSSTLTDETLGILPNPWTDKGVKFSLSYLGESLGNPSGGLRQGAIYEGRLNLAIDLDMAKLAALNGLTFHADVLQIHGQGLSREDIHNFMPASSLEALPTTRLYEMWFEQQLGSDRYTIRAGQLAADTEFITTKYADALINSTFGWPAITSVNLPSGGPSTPLAAVGARFKGEITERLTVLAAIFNGDPAGPGPDDPQSRDRYGLNFRVNDGQLLFGEIQYAYNNEKNSTGLPGDIKIGAWHHSGDFNDQRFAANGVSQASLLAASQPAQLHTDYGAYAVFEQLLLTLPGGDGKRGVAMFVRGSANPSDRNLIEAYADGGLTVLGPLASRPDDKLTLGFAYSKISSAAAALDEDYRVLTGSDRPVRDYEGLITLGYLAEIRKGWTVLPNVQYILHPGGGYVMDNGTPRVVHDALVLGLRTVLKF
jgi:porin